MEATHIMPNRRSGKLRMLNEDNDDDESNLITIHSRF